MGGLALSLVMGNRSSVGITYRTIILRFFHEDVQSLVEWMACGSGDLWHFPLLTVPQDTRTALRRWRSYITKGQYTFNLVCTLPLPIGIRLILSDIVMSFHDSDKLLQEVQVLLESQPRRLINRP